VAKAQLLAVAWAGVTVVTPELALMVLMVAAGLVDILPLEDVVVTTTGHL
jgi:hypothetical protein